MSSLARNASLLLAAAALPLGAARADEGMWTFDAFPAAKMKSEYGWAPDQAWLDRARMATVRLSDSTMASRRAMRASIELVLLLEE